MKTPVKILILLLLLFLLVFFSFTKFVIVLPALICFIYVLISRLELQQRKFLIQWLLICLSLRVGTAILINSFAPATENGFFFPDAASYHKWGERIASLWAQGTYPDLFNDPELRTFHTVYYRLVAGIYFISGAHPELPIFVNCIASTLTIIFVFYIALLLFSSISIARTTAVILALHPSFWFWSSFLLKDVLHVLFFLWAILIFLYLKHKYNYWLLLLLIALLYFIFRLRAYGAFLLIATFIVYLLIWTKQRRVVFVSILLGILLFLAASQLDIVRTIYRRLIYSFLILLPDEYNTSLPNIFLIFITGTIKFFLAPFAWIIPPRFDIYILLYPGQWFLYLFVFPFALTGLYYAIRRNLSDCFILFFPVVLSVYFFLLVYQGAVPRQRLYLEALIVILAGYGLHQRIANKFLLIYYSVFSLGIVGHLVSLYLRSQHLFP